MEYGLKELDADIMTLAGQGFQMANSGAYKDGKQNGNFDSFNPDIVMVKDGGVTGELLPNDFKAIACMHSSGLSNSFMHMTLSRNTTPEQIDKLHDMGGFFFELEDGRHAGFVNMLPIGAKDKEGILAGFEDRMMDIASLNLETEPYAFNPDVLSLLPFMANDDGKLENSNDLQIAQKIVHHLQEFSGAVDVPEPILDRAMSMEFGHKQVVPDQLMYDNRPKMSPGMRPS
ncbi:MAG: hypothetical protein CL840_03995 [Crocinitomicaceae bacterium]|nr:hypothetical protein [Crocinitomicaceae bacterium]|tara:strand:+ start:197698 stop:198387 length:690 start_codon:yes stop_codon:yes gene_type:complete